MKKGVLLLTLLCSLPLYGSTLSDQASAAWQMREQPGKTEEAIRHWREAAQKEPQQAQNQIHLTKALGRAVRQAKTSKEKRKWADEARASAEQAIKLAPDNADAYAVNGEALGQWAEARKGVRSLGAVKKAVAALNKAVEINPNHHYAHMLLTEFYRQAPSSVSVGDKEKALHHAKLAVEYGPEYAINHLVLARTYIDLGKKEEAAAELRKILALTAPADAVPETKSDQRAAQALLQTLESSQSNTSCVETGKSCTEAK